MLDFLLFPDYPSADTEGVTHHDSMGIMHIQPLSDSSINKRQVKRLEKSISRCREIHPPYHNQINGSKTPAQFMKKSYFLDGLRESIYLE